MVSMTFEVDLGKGYSLDITPIGGGFVRLVLLHDKEEVSDTEELANSFVKMGKILEVKVR